MVKNALQGFDANGRPDDLLARITYDKSVYANAFLFTEGGEAGTDEAKEKRNRFPKNENLELIREFEREMESKQDEVVKERVAEAEKAAEGFRKSGGTCT
mmetsp:Transcript_40371/g.64710  ORF Transcript_40371/g.64710 Transcript_40371/m.64710 type:complete len:100 (+) Transcript_40371:97-396(+)